MKKNKKIVIFILIILFLSMTSCKKKTEISVHIPGASMEEQEAQEAQETEETQTAEESLERKEDFCYVHICGEVKNPGVYRMNAGDRIYLAIELAGGFTVWAATDYVNQAKAVEDGMKIEVPKQGEEPENQEEDGLVNINVASRERLCTLPGIGESRAESIIAYREQYGAFEKAEDIMKVEGIKEGAFSKLKDKITVR